MGRIRWAMLAVAGVSMACGDDDGMTMTDAGPPPADTGPIDTGPPRDTGPRDSGPPPDAGPTGEDLTFVVTRFGGDAPPEGAPAAGATVALEMPDGTVTETEADATGEVTFRDVDTSEPLLTLTGYLEGHIAFSSIGLAYVREIGLPVFALPSDDVVTLSGAAANMMDETHRLNVYSLATNGTVSNAVGPMWNIDVPRGRPATVLGLEFHVLSPAFATTVEQQFDAWTIADAITPATDTMVMLDFADATRRPATHDVLGGSFALPADGTLRTGSTGYLFVNDRDADGRIVGAIGYATRIGPDDGRTRMEFDAQYIDVPGVDHADAFTRYILQAAPAVGFVTALGLPKSGDAGITFLGTPSFSSSDPLMLASGTQITLDSAGAPDGTLAQVFIQRDGVIRWVIAAVLDGPTATLRIPALPSTADRDALLGTGSLDAMPQLCDIAPEAIIPGQCNRASLGRAIEAIP